MKVLIVNGYSRTSKGDKKFSQFHRAVINAFKKVKRFDIDAVNIVVKHRTELSPFIYEVDSTETTAFDDPTAITRFDQLDFVFMDGPGNEPPWSPRIRAAAILAKMCFLTKKCFFGAGFATTLLAHLCSTGGDILSGIVNTAVEQNDLESFVAPQLLRATPPSHFINRNTGDFYQYDDIKNNWVPRGNSGIVLHSATSLSNYGARKSAARGSGRRPVTDLRDGSTHYISRLGETKCCVRLDLMNHWSLKTLRNRDFKTYVSSKWDIEYSVSATSATAFETIVDSPRGPLLIEYKNLMACHFCISDRYKEGGEIMAAFVKTKHAEIKVQEHLDTSFTVAISSLAINSSKKSKNGSVTTRPQTAVARSRNSDHKASRQAWGFEEDTDNRPVVALKASPKRIRPYTANFASTKNTVKSTATTNNFSYYDDDLPEEKEESIHFTVPSDKLKVKVQRVASATRRRPYSSYKKFKNLAKKDNNNISNDGTIYQSQFDRDCQEYKASKAKWVSEKNFERTFGKATTATKIEAGIVNTGEFHDDEIPFLIMNRKDHPEKFVDQTRRFRL